MCGFVGFIAGDRFFADGRAAAIVAEMAGCVRHRGPDHGDHWVDPEARVALGHRRLAIVDLSPAGDQPMRSPSGRYVTVYNGEIYNHLDLRRELEAAGLAPAWRGQSDTETLLAAIDAWGVERALQRSVGMFGLALWDEREKALFLARDRAGEKPLYYGWQGEGAGASFLFGSELKALASHPAFVGEIDRQALTAYLRHNGVPSPLSIYRGIAKLEPGSFLRLASGEREPVLHRYWSAAEVARSGVAAPLALGPEEAVEELEKLLTVSIGQQMIADVPLGAFLSGGVDSSAIVALMQKQAPRPVKTFSIGFDEEDYNEAHHAKAVAAHLGTDHTEMYVSPSEAMDVIPRLPRIYDEPFADSSQIPTFLVSQLARRHVTVSLSGDAGDEVFAGYNRYKAAAASWRKVSRLPRPVRSGLGRAMAALPARRWDSIFAALDPVLPARARMRLPGDKMHKAAAVLHSRSTGELYQGLLSIWREPADAVIGGGEPESALAGLDLGQLSEVEQMMLFDMLTYLPNDILTKVDRAAMSVSLETRVPFLDHRVVEFAWRLPLEYKIRDGETKWVLRQLLYRHVPRALIERPKTGFGVPINYWLAGPLRDWAESLLAEDRLRREGYFEPAPVRARWREYLGGAHHLGESIWSVLMFQSWHEEQGGASSASAPAVSPVARVA